MKQRRWLWLSLILVLLLGGCGNLLRPTSAVTKFKPAVTTTAEPPSPIPTEQAETFRRLTILYTSDEHGWMEASDDGGGAAALMGLWRERWGYTEDGPFLILSGGDMWTGPAISSWYDGQSMAEVMNLMGYDAAAIGNHEFDFGLDVLRERAAQSEFPLLSANIRDRETGAVADIALPYVIREVGGIRVGLIGLTTVSAPQTTNPDHVAGFDFIPYQQALEEIVPQVRADGAQLLVVVGHFCVDEMRALVPLAAELGVAVMGGGHCHELVATTAGGVAIIEGGEHMHSYAKVELTFDTATGAVVSLEPSPHLNTGGTAEPEVAALVAEWRVMVDDELLQEIGYVNSEIVHRSEAMFNMVTDAWLAAYPSADVALANRGSFRQGIPAGEITLATIVGMLPFDNVLIDVKLTGAQLIENIECCHPVVGGMTTVGSYELSDGTPIDPDRSYHVLVNDFMYIGGDSFKFQEYDPDAYDTSIDWRQPVIDWILSLNTSPESSLDKYLDSVPR